MTDLQRLLETELDHEEMPSLDGVVERSVRDGQRMRRTRGLRSRPAQPACIVRCGRC
jgi:hypothetical protein